MQRRTHECFRRSLRDAAGVRVLSYAPFVPTVPNRHARTVHDEAGRSVWSMSRFAALLLGEMRRLYDDEQGYGPMGAGFIDHVDIPSDVMDAQQRLAVAHPHSLREPLDVKKLTDVTQLVLGQVGELLIERCSCARTP